MEGLTAGRIVHYVDGMLHRAATITYVWDGEGIVNLFVFPDGSFPFSDNTLTSIRFDDGKENDTMAHGTWHWIEKA